MSKYRIVLLTLTLIALALRLTNLTYHSLWFDEAVSVYWARQSVPRILEVGFTLVEDRLPPLYYLTLKGWGNLIGFSETAVRLLSVFYGVLLVPVAAGLAAMLFNRRVALISAALITINPFLVWYSQEARMYAPAVFFSTLAVWAFLKWLKVQSKPFQPTNPFIVNRAQHPSIRPRPSVYSGCCALLIIHNSSFIILFILAALAGLYHHLYAGFVLPGLGLWLIIAYPRRWQFWLGLGLSGLIITVAFSPIALAIWQFAAESIPGEPFNGFFQRGWTLLQAFTLWQAPLPDLLTFIIPSLVLLFALLAYLPTPSPTINSQSSILQSPNPQSPNLQSPVSSLQSPIPIINYPLLLISTLLLSPFIIATLLLTRNYLAFFGERYFIVMTPWLLMLSAVGVDKVSSWLVGKAKGKAKAKAKIKFRGQTKILGSKLESRKFVYSIIPTLFIILTLIPLPGQWSVPASKEAWRQSVDYLAQHANDDHAILIHPDWVRFPFQFYFAGPGQTYAAFSTVTAETDLNGPLQGVIGDHPVVWLIQSHIDAPDPERRVEQWLAARYPLVTELYPPGIALKGYAPGYQLESLPPEVTPVNFQFSNGMQLVGYQADTVTEAIDTLFHPPSGWVHVTLYWRAAQPITDAAEPTVQLLGPEGVWGIALDRSSDALDLFPPNRWFEAERVSQRIIRHDIDVNLNPVTPPGVYQLVVEVNGEQYQLSEVEVR